MEFAEEDAHGGVDV